MILSTEEYLRNYETVDRGDCLDQYLIKHHIDYILISKHIYKIFKDNDLVHIPDFENSDFRMTVKEREFYDDIILQSDTVSIHLEFNSGDCFVKEIYSLGTKKDIYDLLNRAVKVINSKNSL